MSSEESLFATTPQHVHDAVLSNMFGKPCFKINGKAFACFYNGEMVFKLSGEMHKNAMELSGARLFDPSSAGRPMKAWVQIPYTHAAKWMHFAQAAAAL